tara:strand:- start:248 stop:421 length:174 start_codon:yes stop_codon:yes gene_type:complete
MEGGIYLEAKGLGIIIRRTFLPTENPLIAADSIVFYEDKNRKFLFNSWKSEKQVDIN